MRSDTRASVSSAWTCALESRIENHDEPRAASLLSLAEHRAAAIVITGLPGMCLLHEGQLSGARERLSVHLGRRRPKPEQVEITAFYGKLLGEAVGNGYDGWMEDFGEYTPSDAVSSDGTPGPAMHNLYPRLYHQAAREF